MTFADEIDNHKSRCRQHLVRLRILAGVPDDAAPHREVTAEIRDVTNAIIAEAEAMSRAAIRAAGIRDPQAETFLWARITRLATAADRAIVAARSGDTSRLRDQLRHFDTLTSAIWAVERAAYGEHPMPGRQPELPKQNA